jgi:hypothetical protein
MLLYLYDLFHILQSFLTNFGSRECNVMYVYICKCQVLTILTHAEIYVFNSVSYLLAFYLNYSYMVQKHLEGIFPPLDLNFLGSLCI